MLSTFLHDLAIESEVMLPDTPVEELDETVGDLIEQDHHQMGASEMLVHAHKARDIAEQLDDIAERADELADEDERYSGLSVEALGREFGAVMRANDLSFKAHSFESALNAKGRATGMARDARRVAQDLRANAAVMGSLSTEGVLLDLFRSKSAALKKAQHALLVSSSAIKTHLDFLKKDGVVLKHDGIAVFLTKRNAEVLDLNQGIAEDVEYLSGVEGYVNERLSYLDSLTPSETLTVVIGDEGKVNTATSMIPTADSQILMGNHFVYRFKRTSAGGAPGQFGKVKTWVKFGAAVAVSGKVGQIAGTALIPVIGLPGSLAVTVATGALVGHRAGNSIVNQSNLKSVASAQSIASITQNVMGLDKYANMDTILKDADRIEAKLRAELKPVNKTAFKAAMDELSAVKAALTILQDHSFYLTTQTARLFEYTAKHVKA